MAFRRHCACEPNSGHVSVVARHRNARKRGPAPVHHVHVHGEADCVDNTNHSVRFGSAKSMDLRVSLINVCVLCDFRVQRFESGARSVRRTSAGRSQREQLGVLRIPAEPATANQVERGRCVTTINGRHTVAYSKHT